jgi:hypothetical protein
MIIIKIKHIFSLLPPTICFCFLYQSHLLTELRFLKKELYTIDNTIADYEILHYVHHGILNFMLYLLNKIEFSLKMALLEEAETYSWE